MPNWDAVGILTGNGISEWLLVEAKAHLSEARSSCTAKPQGGLSDIKRALEAVKDDLGVASTHDWLNGYYQYYNRIALLHFLSVQMVPARLVFIYFTGDKRVAREACPWDSAGWFKELRRLDEHIGLPPGHVFADRIHKLFLPVGAFRCGH